jgi:hypothetical protein
MDNVPFLYANANAVVGSKKFNLVQGHLFAGKFRVFPHVCPGDRCAIWAWVKAKAER